MSYHRDRLGRFATPRRVDKTVPRRFGLRVDPASVREPREPADPVAGSPPGREQARPH
ncbi:MULTISPECIES: hypothetical protein [unclassified Nocardia]|uniref:hypothetical protein n=1 Tax=unclassified Nocardia TaxID=2637762 RepID=UPI00278BFCB1|nr:MULTISPECIES: hypothetical protein [unclassified Nocardia]